MIFGPKPPPMNGAITRTWRSPSPSMPASPLRTKTGACVVSQTVSWSGLASHLRDHPARLHRHRRAAVIVKAAADHAIGARHAPRRSPPCAGAPGRRRCRARRRGPCGEPGASAARDRRRRAAARVDDDIGQRVLGEVAALGDHQRQRLADVPRLVLGERHLGALVEDDALDRRRRHQQRSRLPIVAEIVGGVDGDHAFASPRRRDVDAPHARMRDLAAHKRRVQQARQLDVVDEERLAGEQARGPRCARSGRRNSGSS